MDQWPSKFSESFGLDRYWSIECSSLCFRGKRHDNRILKVKILLSRNFVVIAQAPK